MDSSTTTKPAAINILSCGIYFAAGVEQLLPASSQSDV